MMIQEVADYLALSGFGTVGVDLFGGILPASAPRTSIAVFEFGGAGYDRFIGSSEPLESPGLQVQVRNVDYAAGRAIVKSIIQLFERLTTGGGAVLGGTKYYSIEARDNARFEAIGNGDDSLFSVNFSVKKDL
jgi:hypothetical protein